MRRKNYCFKYNEYALEHILKSQYIFNEEKKEKEIFKLLLKGKTCSQIGDIIGCIIAPKGPYAPTVTISTGLLGVLPWVMFKLLKICPNVVKIIASYLATFLICSVLINTTTWYIMYSSKTPYLTYLVTRNSVQAIIVAINCVMTCIVYKPLKLVFKRFGFAKDAKKENIIENDSQN